jgi:hypothetical protein
VEDVCDVWLTLWRWDLCGVLVDCSFWGFDGKLVVWKSWEHKQSQQSWMKIVHLWSTVKWSHWQTIHLNPRFHPRSFHPVFLPTSQSTAFSLYNALTFCTKFTAGKSRSTQDFNYSVHANDATQNVVQWLEDKSNLFLSQSPILHAPNHTSFLAIPDSALSTCVSHIALVYIRPFFVFWYIVTFIGVHKKIGAHTRPFPVFGYRTTLIHGCEKCANCARDFIAFPKREFDGMLSDCE